MSCYTFSHIVNELLDEKVDKISTARGKTIGAKSEIYQGSWTALNAWIESKLSKQKGAGISGFGCFCWELKLKGDITQCRPIFIISDSFVKNFQIKKQRIFKAPETTPIEEINHSILAIKFSNVLTKDMIYSGLRDLFKKIGDFIYRGYDIEIQFTFGTLISKERRVKFEFNQSRLQEILPDRIVPGTLGFGKPPPHLIEEEEEGVLPKPIPSSYSRATDTDISENLGVITFRESEYDYEEDHNANVNDNVLSNTARRIGVTTALHSINNKNIKIPLLPIGGGKKQLLDNNTNAINTMKTFSNIDTKKINFNDTNLNPSIAEYKIPSAPFAVNNNGDIHQSSEEYSYNNNSSNSKMMPQSDDTNMITNTNTTTTSTEPNNTYYTNDRSDEIPSDLKELLDTLANKSKSISKNEYRKGLTDVVLQQAYDRCITSVELNAQQDEETTLEARKSYEIWRNTLKDEKEKAAKQTLDIKNSLDLQKSSSLKRFEDNKEAQKNAVAAFILPANAGQVRNLNPELDSNGNVLSFRSAVAKKVKEQILKKSEDQYITHQDKLNYEREYLTRLSLELDLHNAMKRSNDLEKQRSLLEAWERDGHIKNLKKLQPFGTKPVKDYIQRNLVNADQSYTGTFQQLNQHPTMITTSLNTMNNNNNNNTMMTNTSSSIGSKLNMSIGYDPRKGKL